MHIIFRHYKSFDWIVDKNSDELPIVPNKNDKVWLDGCMYRVKNREFHIQQDEQYSNLSIFVKPISIL